MSHADPRTTQVGVHPDTDTIYIINMSRPSRGPLAGSGMVTTVHKGRTVAVEGLHGRHGHALRALLWSHLRMEKSWLNFLKDQATPSELERLDHIRIFLGER